MRLYESCEEDEDLVVEVLAAVASAIKAKGKSWKDFKKAWRETTMVDKKRKIPKSIKP